jgi:hypothetical protein
MKILMPLLGALLPAIVLAQPRPLTSHLLRCLGAEEKAFHTAKRTGALFDLNQKLIGELILVNGIEGSEVLLREACELPGGSPSVALLRELILRPKGWYRFTAETSAVESNISQELVIDLNAGASEILMQFLGQLQAEAPTPDCLEKYIPGVKKLYADVKWLQEEMDTAKITAGQQKLTAIFEQLERPYEVIARCRAEVQRRLKSKKTDKAAGKPSRQ